jgi:two-component system cell cycle response regulator DivK
MPKVLIVDDEPENVELLQRRLVKRGYEIISANNALDGIALAESQGPALILMDIKMPNIDGLEAMRRLRAGDTTRAIPIIALTAHAMNEDKERATAAGATDYETKPIDLPSLLGKMQTLIGAS